MGYRMTKEESLLEQYRNRCDSLARENAALRVEVTALKADVPIYEQRVEEANRAWSVAKAEEQGAMTELVNAHARHQATVEELLEARETIVEQEREIARLKRRAEVLATHPDPTVGNLPRDLG